MRKEHDETLALIKGLLPAATSTGLAAAFREQKRRFYWPKWFWMVSFLASICGMIAVGVFAIKELESLNSLPSYLFQRLLVLGPIIWLAIESSRRLSFAERIEEDYAYKEAISTSFEGYKTEMTAKNPGAESPALTILNNNVLEMLALQPGRLYDKKIRAETPLTQVIEALPELRQLLQGLPGMKKEESLPAMIGAIGRAIVDAFHKTPPANPS